MSVKILVVAGPNRGATYFLQEGENVAGRAAEASLVLANSQVSKRHCNFQVHGNRVEIVDLGSSNGTFVNGVMVKKKALQANDRVSVGPFVLEVLVPQMPAKIDAFAGTHAVPGGGAAAAGPVVIDPNHFKLEEEPQGFIPRYKKKFDDIFLPVLYDFYERTDYPTLLVSMFAIYSVLSLGFAVYPVLQRSREEVLRQAEHQSKYIAEQLGALNRQSVLEGREGSLITEFAESEEHVQEVVVANMEGRVMAPGSRLNEIYQNTTFVKYRDLLKKNQDLWQKKSVVVRIPDKDLLVAFAPIMVLSKTKGINTPGAIAVVTYSTASIALDPGTIGTVYLEALFWSLFMGVIFLYLVYHVTHKPLEKLMDDMDAVLKGDGQSVEKKYRNDTIDQLVDQINAALSRIPRQDGKGNEELAGGDTEKLIVSNMMRSIEFLALKAGGAMMMLDLEMRIQATNHAFEELTGIRDGQGQLIDEVSRDESFPSMIKEIAGKAADAGNEGVQEQYDFPVGTHKISALALSSMPGRVESYIFIFEKQGD